MEPAENAVEEVDVLIIGAGWSGLVSCKYMLEEGLSVIVLEKRSHFGGVWRYDDDPKIPTVMRSTQCTSSSTVTEMSDFPMPEEMGMFPHHTDVLEYLQSYAEEFKLQEHMRFNADVDRVEWQKISESPPATRWMITCLNGKSYQSKFLIMATGLVNAPNRELEKTVLKGFTGPVYHSHEIKYPLEEYRGKRLLLVGGGETGSDICTDWHGHVESIYWSIPRGQHFFRRYSKVVPWGKPQALDKASSRLMKMIAPFHKGKPGLSWVCKWTTNGSLLAYQGHGIPEWKNKAGFFRFFINKNGKVLDLINYRAVVPKAGIAKCEANRVFFQDGTEKEFDLIIMSTGYYEQFPFLPQKYADAQIRQRYKMVFNVENPTLAFVGLVRPIVGSLVGISELQARWAARVFSGKHTLCSLKERQKEVQKDDAFWNKHFENSSQRISGLVEGFTYIDDIAKCAGIYPNYWALFRRSPRKWLVAFTAPYNGATYHLNNSTKLERAIETMRSHQKTTLGPLQYILILLLRLLWFDWWIDLVSEVKYQIQVSRWWKTIRQWRLVQLLDALWTYPNQFIFDKESDEKCEMSEKARRFLDLHRNGRTPHSQNNGSTANLQQ